MLNDFVPKFRNHYNERITTLINNSIYLVNNLLRRLILKQDQIVKQRTRHTVINHTLNVSNLEKHKIYVVMILNNVYLVISIISNDSSTQFL